MKVGACPYSLVASIAFDVVGLVWDCFVARGNLSAVLYLSLSHHFFAAIPPTILSSTFFISGTIVHV